MCLAIRIPSLKVATKSVHYDKPESAVSIKSQSIMAKFTDSNKYLKNKMI